MKFRSLTIILSTILALSFTSHGQKPPVKKNVRPGTKAVSNDSHKTNPKNSNDETPVFFYEFEKAEFLVSIIRIEHDENGIGKMSFRKKDFDEDFSEPLSLSISTLEKLKALWGKLSFLDSTEPIQSKERDYAHLGSTRLKMAKNGKSRTEAFNWTEDLTVRSLAEEYRKIGTQMIWQFDFEVARQNQPLRTPRLMTSLDSYLRRNAISDPRQMVPFLMKLSDDQSVPLITRNHAARLAKRIGSGEKEKEPDPEENQK